MIADPYKHFLDVSDPDDPLALLAISPEDARNPARIEAALYQRMMQTFRKRAGHGPDAERVRWRLRAAAEALKNAETAPQPARRPIQLSEIEDALRRMLGVSGSADPFTLLGLPPQPSDPATIDAALLGRLGQTYDHSAGRSNEADVARNVLRAAARSLKNRIFQEQVLAGIRIRDRGAARHPSAGLLGRPFSRSAVRSPTHLDLTHFDRQALAILVGSGGWNHASRARLVGLASIYGVSVGGLMKVIDGLSNYAKSGGPRLGTAEITRGQGHLDALPVPARLRVEPDRMERIVTALDEKFSRAFAEDSAAARVRLSIGFGVLTILALLATVWALTRTPPPERVAVVPSDAATDVAVPSGTGLPATATGSRRPHVLRFPYPPTFSSRGLPVAAINAADACPVLPADLDDVLRRMTISADPAEAVYRRWEAAVWTLSTAWVLLDVSTRMEVQAKLREVLAGAEGGAVQQRLWDPLLPISPHRTDEPLNIWRGSWLAGMLTELGHRSTLPPVVVERARTQIRLVLPGDEAARADDFESGAGLWLRYAIPSLVAATELDENTYDYWELWLAAVRRMPAAAARDGLLADAVQALLETPTDLARPGPSTNVLGRLLQQMDFRTSVSVRDRILDLFDDEAITADDLWVLTSVLVQLDAASWFDSDLVVPYDADLVFRRRLRDRIADRWPPVRTNLPTSAAAQGRGIVVDADVARRWRALLERIDSSQLVDDPDTQMRQLIAASLLNKAAAVMGAGDATAAIGVMDTLDTALGLGAIEFLEAFGAAPGERPGQPVGQDGTWSGTFELARNNHDEVLTQLRQLRATAGTDLGPIDAATLVREAYRGSAQDIRAMAQTIIGQSFPRGSNVVIELLDQLPGAPRTDGVSDMLEQITGDPLPRARSETWPFEARQSLVRHALRLHELYDARTDRLASVLAVIYAERAAAARREAGPTTSPTTPDDAARDLAVVLMQRASQAMTANPVPDDLPGLQRRDAMRVRLAAGPVQRFVATQVAVLELMAYLTVAERPAARERVSDLLAESATRRGTAGHVLRQAVEAECAIGRIWNLRIGESNDGT